MKRIFKYLLFLIIIIGTFSLVLSQNLLSQSSDPELILFLTGSSDNPFSDLSSSNHPVNMIPITTDGSIQTIWDNDLGRNVFTFNGTAYLLIPDILGLFKLTTADEMTIEINVKITDSDPGYYCGDPAPTNIEPPNQMVFCKGPINDYPRNYSLGFGWGRDDMRQEYCDPVGYFPGFGFGIGGMTQGFHGPMNTAELAGWRVYSFLIKKNPDNSGDLIVWCYTNRNADPYPANFPKDEVIAMENEEPLIIGNGFATSGTNEFTPNPFYGKIDYIRIYNGILPLEELNANPLGPVPLPIMSTPPTIFISPDLIINSEQQANTTIIATTTDPEGDQMTYRWLEGVEILSNWTNVANGMVNLDLNILPNFLIGDHTLTLEVSDGTDIATDNMILTVNNSSPTVAPTGAGVYEINSSISLGGNVSDFDGDTITYTWSEGTVQLFDGSVTSTTGGVPTALPTHTISTLSLGTHTLILTVNDAVNTPVEENITVEIVDTGDPTLAPVSNATILWPINKQMIDIVINANASDDGGAVTLSATIICDEISTWTTPVIDQTTGTISFQLLADRDGNGDGREYTISITVTDGSGNSSTATVVIVVPHDNRK